MKSEPRSLDHWREYFRTASTDIFGIIEHAIMVAASDCPKEFRLRRDQIAEKLYSCRVNRFCSGHRVGTSVEPGNEALSGGGCDDENIIADVVGKESKVNRSCNNENREKENFNGEVNLSKQIVSSCSYGEAEALNDEIEEESLLFREVFRIKELLLNSQDESDSVLFESLRRLQLMALTVDVLKATEIGKSVNRLRKHGSKQIRNLAQTLIDGWKNLVDEWYNTMTQISTRGDEGTPDSVNPSAVVDGDEEDDEGLPSPPLDDLAFFAAQPTSMELSDFFDGMDDDGNPQNSGEFAEEHENGRKQSSENPTVAKSREPNRKEANVLTKDKKGMPIKRQDCITKPTKPSGRPLKQSVEPKAKIEPKTETLQNKSNSSGVVNVQMKLEATKRKLQESYQQAENAKRQRTIQVMELHDLPKQSLVHKTLNSRPGNHYRHCGEGRR